MEAAITNILRQLAAAKSPADALGWLDALTRAHHLRLAHPELQPQNEGIDPVVLEEPPSALPVRQVAQQGNQWGRAHRQGGTARP